MDFDIDSDSGSSYSSDQEIQDKFAIKYEVFVKKCDIIQKENQMLVLRLLKTKRRIHRLRKERRFLIQMLDKQEDQFRNIPINVSLDEDKNVLPTEIK